MSGKCLTTRLLVILMGILLLNLFYSCKRNPLDIDVSKIQIEKISIGRFDQDFFKLNAENIVKELPELQKKYPEFAEIFIKNILCKSGLKDSACIPEIVRFVNDKDMKGVYFASQKIFNNTTEQEDCLTDIFKYHKYYFPDKRLPHILFMMSGFNYNIATADSIYAIGIEKYLGKNSEYYEMLQIPNYKRLTMEKEYIPVDLVHAWMMNEFPNKLQSKNLLAEMIYQGSLLYLSDALMPKVNDTLKIGFTQKQMDWCYNHEKDMWGHLILNKFLYSTAMDVISKFTGEGPFTTGFVKESPARTGVWIGWRIVKRYMENNPTVTLTQLMNETDAQKILSNSKYKP